MTCRASDSQLDQSASTRAAFEPPPHPTSSQDPAYTIIQANDERQSVVSPRPSPHTSLPPLSATRSQDRSPQTYPQPQSQLPTTQSRLPQNLRQHSPSHPSTQIPPTLHTFSQPVNLSPYVSPNPPTQSHGRPSSAVSEIPGQIHPLSSSPILESPERHVLIVGAGVSGLSCAQYLQNAQRNIRVTVLEARHRPGGRVLTHWFDHRGDPMQSSPTSMQLARSSPTSSLPTSTTAHCESFPSRSPRRQVRSFPPAAMATRNFPSATNVSGALRVNGVPEPSARSRSDHRPRRHDFHLYVSGTHKAARVSPEGALCHSVDIGASIMHGCADANQLVFQRAIDEQIRAPIVAGGGFYESTEHALWFDSSSGKQIPFEVVVDMHNVFFMASRYMASVAFQSDDGSSDIQSVFNCGIDYVCTQLDRKLNNVEQAVLEKIAARSVGYCAPMRRMALMQASAGMEPAGVDAIIGVPHEEDDPPFPGEIPSMTLTGIRQQAARVEKTVIATQNPPRDTIASRRGSLGDRIVLDGYTPFLVDKLCAGVDIRYGKVVCTISKGHCAPKQPAPYANSSLNRDSKLGWDNDPEVATRTIIVSTSCGDVYNGDVIVVTTPLGVLQRKLEEGGINFSPPLSEAKLEAIHGMGMGVHNKIVLRFREGEVFWPAQMPQLNCTDPRFQFFNLNSYGKPGILLVHVFADSGFAAGYWGLSDVGVLFEVMMVLGGMFCGGLDGEDAAAGRARLSLLLGVCENCRKDLGNASGNGEGCRHCGYVTDERQLNETRAKSDLNGVGTEFIKGNMQAKWSSLPLPLDYLVTRWDEDPFAYGSYSYMPCGSNWAMIDELATPEPSDSAHPYLFFAGEHCSDLGWQCLHGAYETGIRAAKEILSCFGVSDGSETDKGIMVRNGTSNLENDVVGATVGVRGETKLEGDGGPEPLSEEFGQNAVKVEEVGETGNGNGMIGISNGNESADGFWTPERERALTRALTGYSDVFGNVDDVVDEIAYALESFKKEPTQLRREAIRQLVRIRTAERVNEGDAIARAFVKFHKEGGEESFPEPFEVVHRRPRMIGLNGNKLKEHYADDIVNELKQYAKAVSENQISYRETLRKIAVKIYQRDGGLMTKRCLSEYLRTQEFGTGPQKELYLEKYLANP